MLLAIFTRAMELSGSERFLLMIPLCLGIAVVYKALRLDDLRKLPQAALILWVSILTGMCLVGIGLWAIFEIMV